MRTIVMSIARMYLWRFLPSGKHARFYSINVMRARHPAWFREDLERLFDLLATGAIRPRVAERISFDEVAEPRCWSLLVLMLDFAVSCSLR